MIGALVAMGVSPSVARLFDPYLTFECNAAQINTPLRISAFLGQAGQESTLFTELEENLYYRDARHLMLTFPTRITSAPIAVLLLRSPEKLANFIYGGRFGNDQPNDGWTYRGRGIGQVTFKDNYRRTSYRAGKDYVGFPDLLGKPQDAVLSFANWWLDNGCNALADDSAIDEITRKVNPAMAGAARRRQFSEEALAALRRTS